MPLIRIAAILLGPTGVFLIVRGLGRRKEDESGMPDVLARQAALMEKEEEGKEPFFERWIRPLAQFFAENFSNLQGIIMPANLETRLQFAGRPFQLTLEEAYGMQWVGAMAGALAGTYIGMLMIGMVGGLVAAVVLGIGGFFLFPLWLDSEADDRQREISLDMMTTLDVLAISVRGGMGFDEALQRFVDHIDGPLQEELEVYLQEISVGVPREEALSHLIERNSCQDLRTFVGALVQGYHLGTPIADVLQEQAQEMRVRHLQLARELGAKATPKIALVTGLFMAPAVAFLVIAIFGFELMDKLGPALGGMGAGPIP